jgi:hypothetical protein
VLEEHFKTNIEKLFPSRGNNTEDDEDEDFYGVTYSSNM